MLTREQLRFYEENGYVIIPHVFAQAEMELTVLSKTTERLAAEAKKFQVTQPENQFETLRGSQVVLANNKIGQVAIKRIVWAAAAAPDLLALGRDQRILSLASQILDSEEADHLINQVHLKEPHDGVSFPWHQDEQNRRLFDPEWDDCGKNGSFVQIIMAIDHCTEENGPLLVIPGSHKWGYLNFGKFLTTEELDTRFMKDHDTTTTHIQVPLIMNPGDVVLMHPRLIHGSWPNESQQSRRVFLNGFSSPGANHKQYPGVGSAKRISLLTGQEIDLQMRASTRALVEMRQRELQSGSGQQPLQQQTTRLTATFH